MNNLEVQAVYALLGKRHIEAVHQNSGNKQREREHLANPRCRDPYSKSYKTEDEYHFIPRNLEVVIPALRFAHYYLTLNPNKKKKNTSYCFPTFLDVGCGIGNIMAAAEYAGFLPFGVELDADVLSHNPYHIAEEFYHKDEQHTFHANAFDFSYKGYDAIYYYCPIRNHNLEAKLEQLIEHKMDVGAILLPFLKQSTEICRDEHFKELHSSAGVTMYQKVAEYE